MAVAEVPKEKTARECSFALAREGLKKLKASLSDLPRLRQRYACFCPGCQGTLLGSYEKAVIVEGDEGPSLRRLGHEGQSKCLPLTRKNLLAALRG